mmetsp:Transcript_93576/g.247194  ORF Transcript_93576/g.247194 Transcript_93576/m.247194 type:complete len:120 (-) Transcript_93576:110-469(-)
MFRRCKKASTIATMRKIVSARRLYFWPSSTSQSASTPRPTRSTAADGGVVSMVSPDGVGEPPTAEVVGAADGAGDDAADDDDSALSPDSAEDRMEAAEGEAESAEGAIAAKVPAQSRFW